MSTEIITIVSGLPRSGTSLLMQMLVSGGMHLFADDDRKADEDNPKGFYEYEGVKNLEADSSWVGAARGNSSKGGIPAYGVSTAGFYL